MLAALKSEVSAVHIRPAAIAPELAVIHSSVSVIGLFCKQTSSYRLLVNKVSSYSTKCGLVIIVRES